MLFNEIVLCVYVISSMYVGTYVVEASVSDTNGHRFEHRRCIGRGGMQSSSYVHIYLHIYIYTCVHSCVNFSNFYSLLSIISESWCGDVRRKELMFVFLYKYSFAIVYT
jgi:hypothetical protein